MEFFDYNKRIDSLESSLLKFSRRYYEDSKEKFFEDLESFIEDYVDFFHKQFNSVLSDICPKVDNVKCKTNYCKYHVDYFSVNILKINLLLTKAIIAKKEIPKYEEIEEILSGIAKDIDEIRKVVKMRFELFPILSKGIS